MNDAEKRRQTLLKKQQAALEEKQRPIRSANSSPTTHHFLVNGLGQQANGLNLLQEILPTPQSHGGMIPGRPATGSLTQGNSGTNKSSPNQKGAGYQRPKTSTKMEGSS